MPVCKLPALTDSSKDARPSRFGDGASQPQCDDASCSGQEFVSLAGVVTNASLAALSTQSFVFADTVRHEERDDDCLYDVSDCAEYTSEEPETTSCRNNRPWSAGTMENTSENGSMGGSAHASRFLQLLPTFQAKAISRPVVQRWQRTSPRCGQHTARAEASHTIGDADNAAATLSSTAGEQVTVAHDIGTESSEADSEGSAVSIEERVPMKYDWRSATELFGSEWAERAVRFLTSPDGPADTPPSAGSDADEVEHVINAWTASTACIESEEESDSEDDDANLRRLRTFTLHDSPTVEETFGRARAPRYNSVFQQAERAREGESNESDESHTDDVDAEGFVSLRTHTVDGA